MTRRPRGRRSATARVAFGTLGGLLAGLAVPAAAAAHGIQLVTDLPIPEWLFAWATAIVLVACYYGYNASGGPVGVGTATAKSMVLNIVLVTLIGVVGSQVFWGGHANVPIGG